MPCDSAYLAPNWSEVQASRLFAIYDEVIHGRRVNPKTYGNGYWIHDGVRRYAHIEPEQRDEMVRAICAKLTKQGFPERFSLEVQVWWRDHQAADREREERHKGEGI